MSREKGERRVVLYEAMEDAANLCIKIRRVGIMPGVGVYLSETKVEHMLLGHVIYDSYLIYLPRIFSRLIIL
jgi:hypothetical protein